MAGLGIANFITGALDERDRARERQRRKEQDDLAKQDRERLWKRQDAADAREAEMHAWRRDQIRLEQEQRARDAEMRGIMAESVAATDAAMEQPVAPVRPARGMAPDPAAPVALPPPAAAPEASAPPPAPATRPQARPRSPAAATAAGGLGLPPAVEVTPQPPRQAQPVMPAPPLETSMPMQPRTDRAPQREPGQPAPDPADPAAAMLADPTRPGAAGGLQDLLRQAEARNAPPAAAPVPRGAAAAAEAPRSAPAPAPAPVPEAPRSAGRGATHSARPTPNAIRLPETPEVAGFGRSGTAAVSGPMAPPKGGGETASRYRRAPAGLPPAPVSATAPVPAGAAAASTLAAPAPSSPDGVVVGKPGVATSEIRPVSPGRPRARPEGLGIAPAALKEEAAATVAASPAAPPGASPKDSPEKWQREWLDHYREVGAPNVIKALLARGEVAKAEEFQAFLDRSATRASMENWARGAHAASVGDFDGFADNMAEAYNRLDYFGDDTTIVREDSGFIDEAGKVVKRSDGKPIAGARIVFRDENTGNTFEQVFDSPDDMIRYGVFMLAPEEAFEWTRERVEAAATPERTAAQAREERKAAIDTITKADPSFLNRTPEEQEAILKRYLEFIDGGSGEAAPEPTPWLRRAER